MKKECWNFQGCQPGPGFPQLFSSQNMPSSSEDIKQTSNQVIGQKKQEKTIKGKKNPTKHVELCEVIMTANKRRNIQDSTSP